ncbi:glycine cleavage system aminomethyltransferase GcvT [Comamonas endophytica]|uniref:aminomethyltransferase n=1 Tax=Comamonas endophytica TaxID=2949090 RepID=A0ABY6GAA8_9BURK|nr:MULTISPECIES: glycine cleavage system aminomethyltransferase GcvT [unclassified Acidovorax]MCD2512023.1 glycine cleavage system aminomethyltransferase GcvT [Acidovorax sp. D4N7]UYG51803.1 glycine cleavage system aminomethyltransferase GcvT [Acidovorax sp. 5MLIR]
MTTASPNLPHFPHAATGASLQTPLHSLHLELGARMVEFAGYQLPVQFAQGLMAEHLHTRAAASLFDVSHMGQLRLVGADAAAALETLMPIDVLDLPVDRQRYGLLLNEQAGILDDLMLVRRSNDFLLVVNGACKRADLAHLQARIGERCEITPLAGQALLAFQGPLAVDVLQRLVPGVGQLRFMDGAAFVWEGSELYITRSGYTGEDGFEISLPDFMAETLARALLLHPEAAPAGLGARNSLRLEAGLCLYGNELDENTTPAEAGLLWAVQKARRAGGEREGGFPGAARLLAQMADPALRRRQRVGLRALERVPVREPAPLCGADGRQVGQVTSGLLSPSLAQPIAQAYVEPPSAAPGTRLQALVRGRRVPMEVVAMPFVPSRYYRG